MTRATARRRLLRVVPAAALAFCLLPQAAALADTSASSGTAATVTLVGATVTSGVAQATNNGSQATADPGGELALSVLAPQTLLTSGLLSQHAVARANGTSAACAGVVGSGGSLAVAADGNCTVARGAAAGVVLQLSALVRIKADAIVASCTAASDGTVTSKVQLVNAAVYTAGALTLTLDSAPAVGASVSVPGVATLGLNNRTVPYGPGSVRTSALTVSLVGSVVGATIAAVTCGPNALVLPTPALPVHGLPLAGALLAMVGTFAWRRRRRITAAVTGAGA